MKYTTKFTKNTQHLPEVGECYGHEYTDEVFMRIADEHGRIVYPSLGGGHIFSVSLSSGRIMHTSTTQNDIIILTPESLKFTGKR